MIGKEKEKTLASYFILYLLTTLSFSSLYLLLKEQLTTFTMSLVRRYAGSVITFNLLKVDRIKKDQDACRGHNCCNNKEIEEIVSESWEDENDNDRYLMIRLIFQEGSYPWLVAHHGFSEVFKAPLFVPIVKIEDERNKTLSLFLRDFAGRGNTCIKRKFYLSFRSVTEAESFKFAHNKMLHEYDEAKKRQAGALISAPNDHVGDSSIDTIDLLNNSSFSFTEEVGDVEEKKNEGQDTINADENKGRDTLNADEFDKKLNLFNHGAVVEHDSFIDDHFENTQDVYAEGDY